MGCLKMREPKTLHTTITYRFLDGTVRQFQGKSCYRLANSWHDAMDQVVRACKERGERYSRKQIVDITD